MSIHPTAGVDRVCAKLIAFDDDTLHKLARDRMGTFQELADEAVADLLRPAEANPCQDGSEQHALWAAGHEKVAGAIEANESEGS